MNLLIGPSCLDGLHNSRRPTAAGEWRKNYPALSGGRWPPAIFSFLVFHWLCAIGVVFGFGGCAEICLAAEPAAKESPAAADSLQFVKVFIPEDRIADFPRQGIRYAPPIDAKQFQQLVDLARSNKGGPPSAAAMIIAAQYTAKLDGTELTGGRAVLDVKNLSKGPAVLPLEDNALAIGNPQWEGSPPRPAIMGLSASGKLIVLADRSAKLAFDWSLRGKQDALGVLKFQVKLPRCAASRMTLELPAGMLPVVDRGVVSRVDDAGQAKPVGSPGALRFWQIDLGGHNLFVLKILSLQATGKQGLVLLRENVTYDFSLRGVELLAQWTLDVHYEPLRQVVVLLDPSLQLAAARYGKRDIPWTISPGEPGRPARAVLELPELIQGTERVLRVRALAPLKESKRWRLPTMRPQGMFWQEGGSTLLVRRPLSLQQLSVKAGRQQKVGPLPGTPDGESIQLQYYGPEAEVDVVLGRQPPWIELSIGTTIQLGTTTTRAHLVADIRSGAGEHFLLEAAIGKPWIIESVQAERADWNDGKRKEEKIRINWKVETLNELSQILKVRFDPPIKPDRPVRLVIRARRGGISLGEEADFDDLRLATFVSVASPRPIVAVRAEPPYQLHLSHTTDLNWVDRQSLDVPAASLLQADAGDLLFQDDSSADPLRLSLSSERARYQAEIDVEASVTSDALIESYTVNCNAEAAQLDRLIVHLSQARSRPISWSIAGEQDRALAVRKLSHVEQIAAGAGAGGEAWEITLRRRRTVPFQLRGSRISSLKKEQPIALASLPEATEQSGRLTIRASRSAQCEIRNYRLKPIPAEITPPGQFSTARAVYRYQPAREALAASDPAIVVKRAPPGQQQPGAWAWECHVQSRWTATGAAAHRATYHIENTGLDHLQLAMPAGLALRGLSVDLTEVPVNVAARTKNPGKIMVPLPAGSRYVTLSIDYSSARDSLAVVDRLQAPLPQIDIPVFDRRWTAWLPPDYAVASVDRRYLRSSHAVPAWGRRLLGPLRAEYPRQPFHLFSARHWQSLLSGSLDRDRAMRLAEPLLSALGRNQPTWRQLVSGYLSVSSSGTSTARLSLLIDARALDAEGITVDSPIIGIRASSTREQAVGILARANLALLVHQDAMLLTVASSAALDADQLTWIKSNVIARVCPGPLAAQMQAALRGEAPFVTARQWISKPPGPRGGWITGPRSTYAALADAGWTAVRLQLPHDTPPPLRIYHRQTFQSLAWIAFLLAVVAGWGRWLQRPGQLLLVAAAAGVIALLVPVPYVRLASSVLLGMLTCLAIHLVRLHGVSLLPSQDSRAEGSHSTRPVPQLVGMLLAGWILIVAATIGLAQQADSARTKPASALRRIFRVLVPVNEEGKPTGKYYVPEEFYKELHRRAEFAAAAPEEWLIRSALYRATLDWQTAGARLDVMQLKASYEIEVLRRGARVRIPLGREGVHLLQEGTLLDDRPTQIDWEPDGGAIALRIEQPGTHRLQLTLRPTSRLEATTRGFNLTIPRLAGSRLELEMPTDAPPVQLPSARGSVSIDTAAGRVHAELGPTGRLIVEWPEKSTRGENAADLRVEELFWLKVRPGSVVLEAKFKFTSPGQIHHLRLHADPRLRMLPLDPQQPFAAPVSTLEDNLQTIHIDLKQPVSNQVTLHASFFLRSTSGVGKLRLPRLEAQAAQSERRLLAVTVGEGLSQKITAGEEIKSLDISEFFKAWGDEPSQPQFAYQLPRGEVSWSLATKPIRSSITSSQNLTVSFDRQSADLHFYADLRSTGQSPFQYRLAVPADLQISRISVVDAKNQARRDTRWSRDRSDVVTVFLDGPADNRQRLTVEGKLPTRDGDFVLPQVKVIGSTAEKNQIQIYRRPAVLVNIAETTGLNQIADPHNGQIEGDLGRLVARLEATSEQVSATVQLAANNPQVSGTLAAWLRHKGDTWNVQIDYRVDVTQGRLDLLRLDIPDTWGNSIKLDPPASFRLSPVQNAGRRQLIIRPRQPITGKYQIRISGPLAISPDQRVQVPRIVPLEMAGLRRLVVVPKQIETQRIAWDITGLSAAKMPGWLTATEKQPDSYAAYQVVGQQYRAFLKPSRRIVGVPRVPLADIHVAWQADRNYHGIATFDLEPAGLDHCTIKVPSPCRLIQVSVEGLPTRMVAAGSGAWRVRLGSDQLPQRIEVVFAGRLTAGNWRNEYQIPAPILYGLKAQRTLWTVYGPNWAGAGKPHQADAEVSALQQEIYRLQATTGLINLPNYVRAEWSREELDRFVLPWQRLWRTTRGAAVSKQFQPGGANDSRMGELNEIDQQHLAVTAQLGNSAFRENVLAGAALVYRAQDRLGGPLADRSPAVYCMIPGSTGTIGIRYPHSGQGDVGSRLFIALVLIGAAVLLNYLARHRLGAEWPVRWPRAAGVLIGLAWWLWLSPSLLGWVIVLVSLIPASVLGRVVNRESSSTRIRYPSS